MALGCSGSPDYTLKVINVVTPPVSMGKFSINGYQFGAHDLLVFRGEGAIEVSAVANIYSGQYADRYSKNARSVVLGISRLAFNVGQVIGPVIATSCIQYGGENYYFYAGSAVVFTAVFVPALRAATF